MPQNSSVFVCFLFFFMYSLFFLLSFCPFFYTHTYTTCPQTHPKLHMCKHKTSIVILLLHVAVFLCLSKISDKQKPSNNTDAENVRLQKITIVNLKGSNRSHHFNSKNNMKIHINNKTKKVLNNPESTESSRV